MSKLVGSIAFQLPANGQLRGVIAHLNLQRAPSCPAPIQLFAIVDCWGATMWQFEKLRRTILYHPTQDQSHSIEYPIHQTASRFDFSEEAFREILNGLQRAGFIEVTFEGDTRARVRLRCLTLSQGSL